MEVVAVLQPGPAAFRPTRKRGGKKGKKREKEEKTLGGAEKKGKIGEGKEKERG